MSETPHLICLLLGSNIKAEENLPKAVTLLQKQVNVLQSSSVWESPALGSDGPNFLNAAVLAMTSLDAVSLKKQVLRPLEAQLGRVRTEDKNAPRTIDIDIIIYDKKLLDPFLWQHAHMAVPLAEILPDYQSESGIYLKDFATSLIPISSIWAREDFSGYPFSTIF